MENKLKIGDKLYKYSGLKGIFAYEVIGIHKYSNIEHYEVECQSCTHSHKCKVLIYKEHEKNHFIYIEMVNEDEGDEQYFWHNDSPFFLTEKESLIYHHNEYLINLQKMIIETKNKLIFLEEQSKKRQIEIDKLNDY